jgi:Carboxypeptidase regulatory-like domain
MRPMNAAIGKTIRSCGRTAWFVMIVFLFISCATARLHAQGYAKIVGTVTDATGAIVPNATVTATQTQTGVATAVKSGSDGGFVFPALLPSTYSLTANAKGFENFTQTGVVLEADQSVTLNFKLKVGSSAETITVTADAPQVDTTSGTLSQVIDEARVVDLPLNGRNAAALITLVAGVTDAHNEGNGTDQGKGKTFPAAVVTSANGTSPQQSNYLLNGGNNVDEMTNVNGPFPFPDALQEFSVQTSNYDAEYGQSAGAVVNIVTKSGTEKFHGDGFEFVRNGYFNARPYFATVADHIHRHQYGGVIGGPVIIPVLSKGKSTQFFFGYQHTIYHNNSAAGTKTVPTLAEEGLAGAPYADFGNLCTGGWSAANFCNTASQQIYNPFTGTKYALNRIPNTDFDPSSLAFEKVFPTFTGTEKAGTIGGSISYYQPTTVSFNEYVARVDHAFGDKDHLFGHYYQNYYQQAGVYNPKDLSSYNSYYNTRYQSALLSEAHSFTSNLLNNFIVNYQRIISLRGGPPGSQDVTQAFGVQNLWQPPTGPYMAVSITNYFGESGAAFAGWERNNYTFNDDLHWVRGKHNLQFGGHFELSKYDVTNDYQSYGAFGTGLAGASYAIGNVNAMANFETGFLTSFQQGNFEQVNDRNHFPGFYAQDSWKITPKLTIDYGVRWENFAPWQNKHSKEQEFFPELYQAGNHTPQYSTLPAGMMLDGDPGVPQWGLHSKMDQWMPRGGFAYDVFGNGKTVVRGGGGIFYQDRMPGFFNLNQASFGPNTIVAGPYTNMLATAGSPGGPFSNPYCMKIGGSYVAPCSAAGDLSVANGGVNPFPFTLPFPSSKVFPTPLTIVEYDPSGTFQVPVTYSYNLTVERQLFSSWAVRLAYVGSGSRHQFVNLEINPAVNTGSIVGGKLTFPGGTANANTRRVYNTSPTVGPCTTTVGCATSYSDIIKAAMIGSAKFNSFQATLEKKMSHGLSLLANYTWSKALDDMPQATRVGNSEDLNAGASYVYPLYPSNATGIPAAAMVPDFKALDRGLSDVDKPQAISFSYMYALPKMHSGNGALKQVVNGWRTSGLIQHHSGDSLTAYMGTDNSSTGLSQDRALQDFTKPAYLKSAGAGDCQAGKSCVAWLNPAAFSVPANTGAGTGFGNVVKSTLRGPGYTNWDGAVIRTFPIWRETNLEFRAEYFDLLNHAELNNPNVSNPVGSSTSFGTITSTVSDFYGTQMSRQAQFSLKYSF